MRSRFLLLFAIFALAVGGGFVAGCGDDDDDGDGGGGAQNLELIQEGQLLVGTDTPYAPFEIGQPPDITGFDIEVMNAIAEKLGVEATYQDTSFDTIFRDTANGQFDIAAAASTITADREKTVDFSDPYYQSVGSLVVTEDSDIASFDDVAGKIVGTQDGTTFEEYANTQTDAAEVRGFPEGPDAIAALRTGQVEAVIIDKPVAVDAVEKQGGVEIVADAETDELFGFPMAPDSDNLEQAVNDALQEIKDDGTLAELYQKYFKVEPPASVLEGTTTTPAS
jgi:polar amino acid transport system substrate-binding protein